MLLGIANGKEQGSHARGGRHRRGRRGKHVRERKLQPNHRCPVQRLKLASEREQEIDTRLETRKTTQRGKKTGREKSYYNHSARWREGLQPDQSRRWSAEQYRE